MTITETLRAAANASTLSQAELARASGIPESGISRFLAGSGMRSENMDALAKVLGLELTPINRKAGKATNGGNK